MDGEEDSAVKGREFMVLSGQDASDDWGEVGELSKDDLLPTRIAGLEDGPNKGIMREANLGE